MGSGPDRGQSPVEWGEILSVHMSVCPSVRLFVRSPGASCWGLRACQRRLRAYQRGLGACQRGLGACQRDLRACQRGLRASQRGPEGLPEGPKGLPGAQGGTYERTDVWTDVQNFSPFYRPLSPCGAAALLTSETSPHQSCRLRVPPTS